MQDAKANLSRYLRRVEQGETIILCRHNRPVAEIRPLATPGAKRREFGLDQGKIAIAPEFSQPLEGDLLDYFDGKRP